MRPGEHEVSRDWEWTYRERESRLTPVHIRTNDAITKSLPPPPLALTAPVVDRRAHQRQPFSLAPLCKHSSEGQKYNDHSSTGLMPSGKMTKAFLPRVVSLPPFISKLPWSKYKGRSCGCLGKTLPGPSMLSSQESHIPVWKYLKAKRSSPVSQL